VTVYRYESRRVSRDGFISYDGVRYGVPWEYSSRQVTVRAGKDRIEIFDGLQRISEHAVEPRSGRIVYLEGQYRGLAEKHGMAFMPSARQTAGNVEKRSLAVYEELLEVSNG